MENIKIENCKYKIIKINIGDVEYPKELLNIHNPPKSLYCIGKIELLNTKSMAIVGARRCSEYGRIIASKIGKAAALNNITVVSGMAAGIDSFAHEGCLIAGGNTIAILGCGIDICYPKSNRNIYERIANEGLLVSEFEIGFQPLPRNFPIRNRIIAGLSEKIIVVEAMGKSGSIITAEIGIEQGKEVMAIPGNITSQYSLGTNKLIADGIPAVAVIEDIFYGFRDSVSELDIEKLDLGADEKVILDYVKRNGEIGMEELYERLNMSTGKISGIVSVLEMKGLISYDLGKVFII